MNETSNDTTNTNPRPTLESVEQQFELWRSSRTKKRELIPQHLWQAAVELCKILPITHVCRGLRLSSPALKKRLSPEKSARPQFVELTSKCLFGQWQLVCEQRDGARLQFSGSGNPPDAEAVIKQFLS